MESLRLAYEFELDQSQCKSLQVDARPRKQVAKRNASCQLASTCETVWLVFKALFMRKRKKKEKREKKKKEKKQKKEKKKRKKKKRKKKREKRKKKKKEKRKKKRKKRENKKKKIEKKKEKRIKKKEKKKKKEKRKEKKEKRTRKKEKGKRTKWHKTAKILNDFCIVGDWYPERELTRINYLYLSFKPKKVSGPF